MTPRRWAKRVFEWCGSTMLLDRIERAVAGAVAEERQAIAADTASGKLGANPVAIADAIRARGARAAAKTKRATMRAADLSKLLQSFRFSFSSEKELQEGIAQALTSKGVSFEREVVLARGDVIDFLVGAVGIEVKIGGSLSDLTRQLHRYAQHERVGELLVVTSRARLSNLPSQLNGKPVVASVLFGSML